MKWGEFLGLTHIITLLIALGIALGLYFILKNKSQKIKIITLGILSFSGIIAIIYNLIMWNSPIEYLPLHMCSITAVLLPITVFTKKQNLR